MVANFRVAGLRYCAWWVRTDARVREVLRREGTRRSLHPMQTPPFITITDNGVTVTDHRPVAHIPHKHDYSHRPVKVAIHHDLRVEIHGNNFTTSTKLSVEDALGLIAMLGYLVREHTCRTPTQFVEVAK